MVHKTSHRGVHSGNTLRAFNTLYSRRYHNQACIVSRVRPELLKKLVDGQADHTDTTKQHNVAVNVALSLNKQYRWLMPGTLISQIKSNDMEKSELTVSLLERHKLKRPASCVSFHSNKGQMKRIQPRNGRYFSFSFPLACGKSRRALRREVRQEMQRKESQEIRQRMETMKKIKTGKMITVYTENGQSGEITQEMMLNGQEMKKKKRIKKVNTEQRQAKGDMEIGESEIRYEVFYPCPAQSSISHNPRYIKQDIISPPGDDTEHVLHGKPKKQHRGKQRKRMTLKDIDECDLPSYHITHDPCLTFNDTDNADREDGHYPHSDREHDKTMECLLTSLIEKSERLQNLPTLKRPRKKKTVRPSRGLDCEEDKAHIVYLPKSQEQDDETHAEQSDYSIPPVPTVPSGSTRVLLPTSEVTTESLRDCFGQTYFEASCRPRRFLLDVTTYVQDLLKKEGIPAHIVENSVHALSYLVCIHDGFYDAEYDVYKVLLNTKLRQGLLDVDIHIEDGQDLFRGSVMTLISRTLDFLQEFACGLKEKSHFNGVSGSVKVIPKTTGCQIKQHMTSADTYVPSVQRLFQIGSAISDVAMPSVSDMLSEDPVFCDICYDEVSPLIQDSVASTALLKCNHRVCDSCWSQHIHNRFHQGFVRVTCPGYDCQEDVKLGVLLSLTSVDTVDRILQRQEEIRIGASQTEKWCPNESCGRVISLLPSLSSHDCHLQQDVECACGTKICFQCLMPAHWPASCNQAKDYRTTLSTAIFPDRLAEIHDDSEAVKELQLKRKMEKEFTLLVEGKHCPKCRTFVLKNGGCPQMVCRCGQMFCWYCAKPGYSHPNRKKCVDENEENKLATTVVFYHHKSEKADVNSNERQPTAVTRRRRVSLMERAVEHHQHHLNKEQHVHAIVNMAKCVSSAALKDKTLAQHMIKVCSKIPPTAPSTHPLKSSTDPVASSTGPQMELSVFEVVSSFLKNTYRTKQELHEVVEYSLVLLKDLSDSRLRQRALKITEDLGAFCSFIQSIFDATSKDSICHTRQAVKAVIRLAEIQGWIHSALATHIVTVRKLRSAVSCTL